MPTYLISLQCEGSALAWKKKCRLELFWLWTLKLSEYSDKTPLHEVTSNWDGQPWKLMLITSAVAKWCRRCFSKHLMSIISEIPWTKSYQNQGAPTAKFRPVNPPGGVVRWCHLKGKCEPFLVSTRETCREKRGRSGTLTSKASKGRPGKKKRK